MKGSGILPTMLITDLIKGATAILQQLSYSPRDIDYTSSTWKQFKKYCQQKQEQYYSTALNDAFYRDVIAAFKPKTAQRKTACMKKLEAYVKTGGWEKGARVQKTPLPAEFNKFLEAQDAMLIKKAYSDNTRDIAYKFCYCFMLFLLDKAVDKLCDINDQHISEYLLRFKGHAKSTIRGELSRLRQFLKHLYLLEYTATDLSKQVPSYHLGQSDSMSKIWESSEIDKVLETVDKSSPKGKRDSAIIIIASELGMRSNDIRNLKLSDIDWENCSISFIQNKTGKPNSLPLNEKVGLAVIDYLRIRPKTDSPYLFVNLIPPYGQMVKFNTLFQKYVHRAGIEVKREAHHGLHSLRATVATKLLSADVSPDVIYPFLGHSDRETLGHYIRLDIENLRECALSFKDGALI